MLEEEQVDFAPRDTKDIYTKVLNNDQNFGKVIIKLIESFINLSKSRELNSNDLIKLFSKRSKRQNEFMHERQVMFLQFALPILEKFEQATLGALPAECFEIMEITYWKVSRLSHISYQYNYYSFSANSGKWVQLESNSTSV